MRGTILLASALLVAAGLAGTVPAPAQSIPDVQRAFEALGSRVRQLDAASSNLLEMEDAMKGKPEFNSMDAVTSANLEFAGFVGQTGMTARILIHMTCPDDEQYVRSAFKESALTSVQMADASVRSVNTFLTHLTSPAVVAEATKIRDLMIEIRDILKPFAGKE